MHWLHWFFLFFYLNIPLILLFPPQKKPYIKFPPKELCSIPTTILHLIFFYLPFASGCFLNYTISYPTVGHFTLLVSVFCEPVGVSSILLTTEDFACSV